MWCPDVLVITVPIDGRYPSANSSLASSRAYGGKSQAYKDLFEKVLKMGQTAVEAGWPTLEYRCRVTIDRYAPDHRLRDAANLGGCECNALTAAKVWTDDSLAAPITKDYHPGADGVDRVVITIHRLPPPVGVKARAALPKQPKRRRGPKKTARAKERMALLNGKEIPYDEALALVRETR